MICQQVDNTGRSHCTDRVKSGGGISQHRTYVRMQKEGDIRDSRDTWVLTLLMASYLRISQQLQQQIQQQQQRTTSAPVSGVTPCQNVLKSRD